MASVRNATERRFQLTALIPDQGPGSFQADCVTIEPGATVEVEDRFLETEGARAFVADGFLAVLSGKPEAKISKSKGG